MQIYWQREWQRIRRIAGNQLRHSWVRWTQRDGVTPPIFANSFPKSGTYMLSRCLELLPNVVPFHRGVWLAHAGKMRPTVRRRPLATVPQGSFVSGHLPYLPEQVAVLRELGFRPILILRDPRDIAVSYYKFEMTYRWLPHYHYFNHMMTDDERLLAMVAGDDAVGRSPLVTMMRRYLGWLADPNCLHVKFEDLVGEMGGGRADIQHDTVAKICDHVGLTLSAGQIDSVAAQIFNQGSQTFRKGAIGDWRNHFSAEHITAFNQTGGQDLLAQLGYASSDR